MRSRIAKSLSVAALAAALAACSSVKLDDQQGAGGAGSGGAGGASAGGIMDPFNPQSVLAQQRSVYFEFNSYTVSDQYRNLVEMHSRYLAGNPNQRVMIEGNTDARGGAEYNLALGQRRAEAVRRSLALLGVADGSMEAISYGKEKPAVAGTNDDARSQNRRVEISYR